MDFGFSEEQEMLRKSARDFLAKESPMTYVRQMMEDDRGFRDEQWKKMAELGWLGLILPEEHGGAGGDFVDMVVVLEEMGRVVLPGPFFSTAILGGVALQEGGSAAQKQELLPKLAAGDLRLTLAQLEPNARWDADGIELEARKSGAGYTLSGTKLFVPDAHTADLLIVAGRAPGSKGAEGVSLFLVDASASGVATTLLKTMDQTRKLCEVVLKDVGVPAERVLGEPGHGWKLLDRIVDRGKVGLCAEMCGGAERVLEMSVEYAKVREQFGRPIGSFQAIQHKFADLARPRSRPPSWPSAARSRACRSWAATATPPSTRWRPTCARRS
jgi:alkylation response protein AidB-like acyl-CoA dehydrogenase